MSDRLNALDASFLFAEDGATSSMHVGALAIFADPSDGMDFDALERHIGSRLARVPRFRQRVKTVPGGLARPVWVDDQEFDLSHHVRRSALPRPGSDEQLREFVARVMARPLDRGRPLWEIYVIEGLDADRFALVTKTHHALVDGVASVDVMQVLLDPHPVPLDDEPVAWSPLPEPSDGELVTEAVADLLRTPSQFVDALRSRAADVGGAAVSVLGAAGGVLQTLRALAGPPGSASLISPSRSTQRSFIGVRTSLEDHRRVRAAHGATVNDVVLTVVTGALRGWLMARGEPLQSASTVRAMVPVSLRGATDPADQAMGEERTAPRTGNVVSAFFVELPVGEPSALVRLQQVAMDMRGLKETGQSLGAKTVIGLAGHAPTTMHALAARAANALSNRVFALAITNIPGPQFPLFALDAQLLEAYPIAPIAHGQAVAVAVASYDGFVHYGLIADSEAMPDLDDLAACLADALIELVEASDGRRTRRGRHQG